MQNILLQYGVLGVVVLGLSGFIMFLIKDHKKERAEWLTAMEKILDKNREDRKEVTKEVTSIIKENTSILSGLKTLFEIHIKGDHH